MMIDTSPNFYAVPSLSPLYDLQVMVMDLKYFHSLIAFDGFDSHGDRYWSKILCGIFPIPAHDLKVKVTDLEFLCKSFVLKF